jgi:hypothetical protein
MLESGVPLTVIASILGWSGSTMVLMAMRYGHIGTKAKQDAVGILDRPSQPESTTQAAATPAASVESVGTIN